MSEIAELIENIEADDERRETELARINEEIETIQRRLVLLRKVKSVVDDSPRPPTQQKAKPLPANKAAEVADRCFQLITERGPMTSTTLAERVKKAAVLIDSVLCGCDWFELDPSQGGWTIAKNSKG